MAVKLTEEKLIYDISDAQSNGDSPFFRTGMFPAWRRNQNLVYLRPDDNIFCTASVAFVLNQLQPSLSAEARTLTENIRKRAALNYPLYQNREGHKTYNFWRTNPAEHFPFGRLLKHLNHFSIPDDIDVTALIYLTLPHNQEDVVWLKEKVKEHANQTRLRVRNSSASGSKAGRVYSTWFGKNMPIDLDVCALCNLMFLFEKHKLPRNEFDEDTYQFMGEVIKSNEFVRRPFQVSHSYAAAPLIIYHFARLMADLEVPFLEPYRGKLIDQAVKLSRSTEGLYRMILETSAIKLSHNEVKLPPTDIGTSPYFRFFIGAPLAPYPNSIAQFLASLTINQIEWHCEALNLALMLERMVVSRHAALNNSK